MLTRKVNFETIILMATSRNIGFGTRFVAYLIDIVCVSVVGSLLNRVSGASVLIGVVYFVYCWSWQNGQTLGNRAMKIRVVKENNKPLDVKTAFIRYIGYWLSGIPLFFGFLWVLWDPKKQGWHDKLARTIVVPE